MPRYKKYKRKKTYRKSGKLTNEEKLKLKIAGILVVIILPFLILGKFIWGCLFRISRWGDLGTCWAEQKTTAIQTVSEWIVNILF